MIYSKKNNVIVIPKNISEISQQTLSNIYSYTMNSEELEKINLLEINKEKYSRWLGYVKYIDNIGYVIVDYICAMMNNNGVRVEQNIYRLRMEPEKEPNYANKKINEFLERCYEESNNM